MKALEKTRYKGGNIIKCSPDGSCPLESYCKFWNLSRERCDWPDKQDEVENDKARL